MQIRKRKTGREWEIWYSTLEALGEERSGKIWQRARGLSVVRKREVDVKSSREISEVRLFISNDKTSTVDEESSGEVAAARERG